MSANAYQNDALVRGANLCHLNIRNIYCGSHTGHWNSSLPVNRLIYIFSAGSSPNRISSAETYCALLPGVWLFIPAFLQVRHEQEDLELLSIHFNVELYQHLELFTGEHLKFGKAPAWRTQMRKFGEISDNFEKSFALRGFIWNFLAQKILPDCTVLEQRIKQFHRFAPLIEKIGRCPWRDLTVAQMAATMHMGKETFAKLFPAATGESPKDFFNQMRAGFAARELENPAYTVAEIAEKYGFSSPFYFSRFFKRYLGVSPKLYQKNSRA